MLHGVLDWEDLDIFFDDEEFGLHATLRSNNPEADNLAIVGIFDTPYQQREFGDLVIDADDPSFTTKWRDEFVHVRKGDKLQITADGTTREETVTVDNYIVDSDSDRLVDASGDTLIIETEERVTVTVGEVMEDFFIDSAPQNDGTGVVAFILTRESTQDTEGDDLDDATDEPPTDDMGQPSGGLFGSNPGV